MEMVGAKVPHLMIDTNQWNNELAQTISWNACSPGGTSFRTHAYHESSSFKAEFKPTIIVRVFAGVFVALGIILPF